MNGWFGDYDKLTMTKIFCQEQLNLSLEKHPEEAIFIGDSQNDEPMFKFFPISIGVRNVEKFLKMLHDTPKFITKNEAGLGFAEMVHTLLQKRK